MPFRARPMKRNVCTGEGGRPRPIPFVLLPRSALSVGSRYRLRFARPMPGAKPFMRIATRWISVPGEAKARIRRRTIPREHSRSEWSISNETGTWGEFGSACRNHQNYQMKDRRFLEPRVPCSTMTSGASHVTFVPRVLPAVWRSSLHARACLVHRCPSHPPVLRDDRRSRRQYFRFPCDSPGESNSRVITELAVKRD